MDNDWSSSKLVAALVSAGRKGLTKADIEKRIPKRLRGKSDTILAELRSAGSLHGPFRNRSDYYFAPQFAPTLAQAEESIEKHLRDAGLRLATKSDLSARASGFLQIFFRDALAALKSEARIIELKRGRSVFYVHRQALLEQLRLTDEPQPGLNGGHSAVTLEDVRPIYRKLKNEQGGIGTVKIYDIMKRLGVGREDLHRLFLDEAKTGRVSLHRASTTKFPAEVIDAGIRLEGQPEPFVTIVLKE